VFSRFGNSRPFLHKIFGTSVMVDFKINLVQGTVNPHSLSYRQQ
jgi:hypothetical protein